jgi:hypothetical protein
MTLQSNLVTTSIIIDTEKSSYLQEQLIVLTWNKLDI